MITWLTKFAFGASASELDDRRLGLVVDETMEIYNWLTDYESSVPDNHPVLRMWTGYEYALGVYGMFHGMEWLKRGFQCSVFWALGRAVKDMGDSYQPPPWLRDKDVLRSHRSNLMRRWPDYYADKWAGTPELMPYLWPVNMFDARTEEPMGYDLMVSTDDKERLDAGERKLSAKIRKRVVNL